MIMAKTWLPRNYYTEAFTSGCYDRPSPTHPMLTMTITKAELTREIVEAVGLTQREAKEMVDAFFSEIAACLMRGEEVKLSGFGSFETRDKVERPGRNPLTGEVVMVTARRVVAFRPSRDLKSVAGTKMVPERVRKVG